VAYAENVHSFFYSVAYGGYFYLICAVCDVTTWRHIHVPNQRFGEVCWHNMHICLHAPPLFMCHWTEYKLSVLQVRSEENAHNPMTQHFITAKISGCALKQRSITHTSMHQSNLYLQNEAALMSCQIRATGHRKCAAGLADAQPGLQSRTLLNYTEFRMRIKHTSKRSIFCYV